MKEYDVPAEIKALFLQSYICQIMVKGCVEALQYEKAEKYAEESAICEIKAWQTARVKLGLAVYKKTYRYNKSTEKIIECRDGLA